MNTDCGKTRERRYPTGAFTRRVLFFWVKKLYYDNAKKMNKFKLKAKYEPAGDQPEAIKKLVEGLKKVIKTRRFWV